MPTAASSRPSGRSSLSTPSTSPWSTGNAKAATRTPNSASAIPACGSWSSSTPTSTSTRTRMPTACRSTPATAAAGASARRAPSMGSVSDRALTLANDVAAVRRPARQAGRHVRLQLPFAAAADPRPSAGGHQRRHGLHQRRADHGRHPQRLVGAGRDAGHPRVLQCEHLGPRPARPRPRLESCLTWPRRSRTSTPKVPGSCPPSPATIGGPTAWAITWRPACSGTSTKPNASAELVDDFLRRAFGPAQRADGGVLSAAGRFAVASGATTTRWAGCIGRWRQPSRMADRPEIHARLDDLICCTPGTPICTTATPRPKVRRGKQRLKP